MPVVLHARSDIAGLFSSIVESLLEKGARVLVYAPSSSAECICRMSGDLHQPQLAKRQSTEVARTRPGGSEMLSKQKI